MSPDYMSRFHEDVARYIQALVKDGRFGVCSGVVRIRDSASGSSKQSSKCDRFKISIPYAGLTVAWEVLFNCDHSNDPPDFIFGQDDTNFMPDIDLIKSLTEWDADDPKALLYVIEELFDEYRKYHFKVIAQHSRLQFEYTSLMETAEYGKKDVEIHVSQKGQNKIGPINFLVRLHTDFKRIPAYMTKDNPGEDSAVLLVIFSSPEGGKTTPQLFLSPRVENALGGPANLRIPAFHNGQCLIDYIPTLCELLNNKVEQVVKGYESRKGYISSFLSHFGQSVVEYDCEGFMKISFVYCWHDFFFLICINLSKMHPAEQPQISFQSVYHEDHNHKPYKKIVPNYPYSPRWSGNEMAERARIYILGNIAEFQKGSVSEGSYR